MASDNKVSMPVSTAGITRYYDDYEARFEIAPGHVIVLIIIIMIIMFMLHSLARGFA